MLIWDWVKILTWNLSIATFAISSMLSWFHSLQHLRIFLIWDSIWSSDKIAANTQMAESIVGHSEQLKSLSFKENPESGLEKQDIITAAIKRCEKLEELALWCIWSSHIVEICKVDFTSCSPYENQDADFT